MGDNTARTMEDASPDTLWFVARGSVLKGPFTASQLEERIKKKEVSYLDYCWKQGFREWRPIASVEALDRRRRLTRLPGYPSVEVPQGGRPVLAPPPLPRPEAAPAPEAVPVRISFSKVHKKSISIYEWALAVVLAVILAHLSTSFALRSVEEAVLTRFQYHRLSLLGQMGTPEAALPPEVWSPLASAPGLSDVVGAGLVEMPVAFVTPLARDSKNRLVYQNYELKVPVPEVVDAERVGLDPVFVQSFEVYGRVSPLDFSQIHVEARGEPWVRR